MPECEDLEVQIYRKTSRRGARRTAVHLRFSSRAMAGKVQRHRRHSWYSWQCGLCNLQNLRDRQEFESHSLRQTPFCIFNDLRGAPTIGRVLTPKLVLLNAEIPVKVTQELSDSLP